MAILAGPQTSKGLFKGLDGGLVAGQLSLLMVDTNPRLKYDDDFPQTETIRVTLWFDTWSVSAARHGAAV